MADAICPKGDELEPLIRYPIFQHAWFVDDLEKTCLNWHKAVGAGPFFITENHVTETQTYRGESFLTPLNYAFGYHGETQVQFIQQDEEAPSIYRDMYKKAIDKCKATPPQKAAAVNAVSVGNLLTLRASSLFTFAGFKTTLESSFGLNSMAAAPR